MKAMVLHRICRLDTERHPLTLVEIPRPVPRDHEVVVEVTACGVCHTEIDEIEGRMTPPRLPIVPGHQIVGRIVQTGACVPDSYLGQRIGIAWIASACGVCDFCRRGEENLCKQFVATGRDTDGGYAEFVAVQHDFVYPLPDAFSDVEAAPLLCAGAIGYRSLVLTNLADGQNLGLTGFGASAHLVLKMVKHRFPSSRVFVFARSTAEQEFARELGAEWAGSSEEEPPSKLHAIIDTTPAWKPVVDALKNLEAGGRLVVNAIRKEDADKDTLLRLNYPTHLWLEKEIKSVANVSRRDVREFLRLAAEVPIRPEVQEYDLKDANEALVELKMKRVRGAKVLKIS